MQRSTLTYLVLGTVAAAISLGRTIAVAATLDPSEFGTYVVVVGMASVLATAISGGWVEGTYKSFPRFAQDGRAYVALRSADSIAWVTSRRGLWALICLVALAWLIGRYRYEGIAVALIALTMTLAAVYASLLRSTGRVVLLGASNLTRAALALALAWGGAGILGWGGAVIGEVAAAVLSVWLMRRQAAQLAGTGANLTQDLANATPAAPSVALFVGFLLQSAPYYADRLVVAGSAGTSEAGKYGLLMLFVTAANVFAGILSQKVGPELVRMERAGVSLATQLLHLGRWAGLHAAAALVGLIPLIVVSETTLELQLFVKYGITRAEWSAVTVLALLQFSVLLDFVLISRDGERHLLASSGTFAIAFAVAALAMIWWQLPIWAFVTMLATAKLVHLTSQMALLVLGTQAKNRRGNTT